MIQLGRLPPHRHWGTIPFHIHITTGLTFNIVLRFVIPEYRPGNPFPSPNNKMTCLNDIPCFSLAIYQTTVIEFLQNFPIVPFVIYLTPIDILFSLSSYWRTVASPSICTIILGFIFGSSATLHIRDRKGQFHILHMIVYGFFFFFHFHIVNCRTIGIPKSELKLWNLKVDTCFQSCIALLPPID